jgi:hypothetical protein
MTRESSALSARRFLLASNSLHPSRSRNRIELEGIPVELLKHAKALVELNLRENPILVEALRERDGWSEFEARRKRRADKALDSRVMLGDNVFDEGADNDRFVRH